MFASGRDQGGVKQGWSTDRQCSPIRRVALLCLSLAALAGCGNGSEARASSPSGPTAFSRPQEDWRPFSPSVIEFYHAEDNSTAGANTDTFIVTPVKSNGVDTSYGLYRVFGNLIMAGSGSEVEFAVSRNDQNPQRPLEDFQAGGTLQRLNSPGAVIAALQETPGFSSPDAEGGYATLVVLMFPDHQQLQKYTEAINHDAQGFNLEFADLVPGCKLSNGPRLGKLGELRVLAMFVPDHEITWNDAADRACLLEFFRKAMGVRREALSGLLPSQEDRRDCIFARILDPKASTEERLRSAREVRYGNSIDGQDCPIAPRRSAASLLWYARQQGFGIRPEWTKLIEQRVLEFCRRKPGLARPDMSCFDILKEDR